MILLPLCFPLFIKQSEHKYNEGKNEVNRLSIEKTNSAKAKNYSGSYDNELDDDYSPSSEKKYEVVKAVTLYFDPNTASPDDWKKLGIKDKTIHTIQNYISKGEIL